VALGLERGFVKIQLVPQKGRISRKQKNAKHGTTIVNPFQKCFKLLSNHSIHSKLQSNFLEKLEQKTAVILTLVKTEEFVKMELTPTVVFVNLDLKDITAKRRVRFRNTVYFISKVDFY